MTSPDSTASAQTLTNSPYLTFNSPSLSLSSLSPSVVACDGYTSSLTGNHSTPLSTYLSDAQSSDDQLSPFNNALYTPRTTSQLPHCLSAYYSDPTPTVAGARSLAQATDSPTSMLSYLISPLNWPQRERTSNSTLACRLHRRRKRAHYFRARAANNPYYTWGFSRHLKPKQKAKDSTFGRLFYRSANDDRRRKQQRRRDKHVPFLRTDPTRRNRTNHGKRHDTARPSTFPRLLQRHCVTTQNNTQHTTTHTTPHTTPAKMPRTSDGSGYLSWCDSAESFTTSLHPHCDKQYTPVNECAVTCHSASPKRNLRPDPRTGPNQSKNRPDTRTDSPKHHRSNPRYDPVSARDNTRVHEYSPHWRRNNRPNRDTNSPHDIPVRGSVRQHCQNTATADRPKRANTPTKVLSGGSRPRTSAAKTHHFHHLLTAIQPSPHTVRTPQRQDPPNRRGVQGRKNNNVRRTSRRPGHTSRNWRTRTQPIPLSRVCLSSIRIQRLQIPHTIQARHSRHSRHPRHSRHQPRLTLQPRHPFPPTRPLPTQASQRPTLPNPHSTFSQPISQPIAHPIAHPIELAQSQSLTLAQPIPQSLRVAERRIPRRKRHRPQPTLWQPQQKPHSQPKQEPSTHEQSQIHPTQLQSLEKETVQATVQTTVQTTDQTTVQTTQTQKPIASRPQTPTLRPIAPLAIQAPTQALTQRRTRALAPRHALAPRQPLAIQKTLVEWTHDKAPFHSPPRIHRTRALPRLQPNDPISRARQCDDPRCRNGGLRERVTHHRSRVRPTQLSNQSRSEQPPRPTSITAPTSTPRYTSPPRHSQQRQLHRHAGTCPDSGTRVTNNGGCQKGRLRQMGSRRRPTRRVPTPDRRRNERKTARRRLDSYDIHRSNHSLSATNTATLPNSTCLAWKNDIPLSPPASTRFQRNHQKRDTKGTLNTKTHSASTPKVPPIFVDKQLLHDIAKFHENAPKPVPRNALEQNNKLRPPEDIYRTKLPIPADFTISKQQVSDLEAFIQTKHKWTALPKPPPELDPLNPKWATELHPNLQHMSFTPLTTPVPKAHPTTVNDLFETFSAKGFHQRHRMQDITCRFCKQLGHTAQYCDLRKTPNYFPPGPEHDFVAFVTSQTPVKWEQFTGDPVQAVANLPAVWARFNQIRTNFWIRWNRPNPFNKHNSWNLPWQARIHVDAWYAMGTPPHILSKILLGDHCRYTKQPPRRSFPNRKSAFVHKEYMNKHLKELCSLGIALPIPESYVRTVLGCQVQEGKKLRLVLNGAPLKFYEPNFPFKLQNINHVLAFAQKNTVQLTWDFMHAFHQLAMTPDSSSYVCFRWPHPISGKPSYWAYQAHIFGKKSSPSRYHRRVMCLIYFANRIGLDITSFYDDNDCFVPDHPTLITATGHFLKKLLSAIGWIVRDHKSDLDIGSHVREYIGYVINTDHFTLSISDFKRDKLMKLIQHAIMSETITLRDVSRIHGVLISMREAVQHTVPFLQATRRTMRHCQANDSSKAVWDKPFTPSKDLMAELAFWQEQFTKLNGKAIFNYKWDFDLYCDSSDTHAGSHCAHEATHIALPSHIIDKSSTVRELWGVLAALQCRKRHIKHKKVRIFVDSACSVTIWMRNGSATDQLNDICKQIADLCHAHDTTIWLRWKRRNFSGIELADRLSKTALTYDWTFNLKLRDYIVQNSPHPFPTVDVFASSQNATLPRYVSQWWDESALAADFFSLTQWDWSQETIWANPPFCTKVLLRTVDFILAHKVKGWLVLPVWSKQAFWKLAHRYAAGLWSIPKHHTIFKAPPHCKQRFFKGPRWDIALFYFNHSDTRCISHQISPSVLNAIETHRPSDTACVRDATSIDDSRTKISKEARWNRHTRGKERRGSGNDRTHSQTSLLRLVPHPTQQCRPRDQRTVAKLNPTPRSRTCPGTRLRKANRLPM